MSVFCLTFIFLFPFFSLILLSFRRLYRVCSFMCPRERERGRNYPSFNTLISCSNLDNWIWMTSVVFYRISKSFPTLYSQHFSMYVHIYFFLVYIFIFSASQIFTRAAGAHTRHWLAHSLLHPLDLPLSSKPGDPTHPRPLPCLWTCSSHPIPSRPVHPTLFTA